MPRWMPMRISAICSPHELGPGLEAAQVVVVVLDGGERHVFGQAGEPRVEARVGVEGHLVVAQLEAFDPHLELAAEDVVVDGLGGGEPGAVDGVELGEDGLGLRALALQVGHLVGREPVVVFVAADGGGEKRVFLDASLPRAVEDAVELGGLVRREGRLRGQSEQREGQGGQKSLHGGLPSKVTRGV